MTMILIALGWMTAAVLVIALGRRAVKCPVSFGAWEHEPCSPSTLNSKPSQLPILINDLARTGALECPRAVPSVSQPSTLKTLN